MKTKYGISKQKVRVISISILASFLTAALLPAFTSAAEPIIRRGSSSTYAVLAGSAITNTGTTTLSGTAGADIGLSPGTSFTGNASIRTTGAVHLTNAAAAAAQIDLATAYGDVAGVIPATILPTDLVSRTILPGTYTSTAGDFSNSGNITFDAGGNAGAVFIFQTSSTLITAESSTMTLANGAQACNIYWQVGSSATIGAGSKFIGSIYALNSITANTSAQIFGQLRARNGAVTLQSNSITNDSCAAVVPASTPVVALTPIEELIREYELFFASEEFLGTEDGGRLPDTNSNSYNYLLIGGSLLVLGTSGLLLRRRLSK
jgi:LPXTG-motif cell wall-anchored protein